MVLSIYIGSKEKLITGGVNECPFTCIRFMETPPSLKNMILLGTKMVITTLADMNIPITVKSFSEVRMFPVSTYVTNIARVMTGMAMVKMEAFNARNLEVLLILSLSCLNKIFMENIVIKSYLRSTNVLKIDFIV